MSVLRRALSFDELANLHVADLFGRPPKRANNSRRNTKAKKARKAYSRPKLDAPPTRLPRLKEFKPIACPCCKQAVNVPAIDIVIEHYRVPKCEENVLRAVWNAKGRSVQTERIFDAMYSDDPDGGPEPAAMYRAFKALLHNLRVRLAESGITIENVGYRQGYRLVIGEK